jgi:hypothetical protein
MPAVGPEPRGIEASVKISLSILEVLGDLGLSLVLVLGCMEICNLVSLYQPNSTYYSPHC